MPCAGSKKFYNVILTKVDIKSGIYSEYVQYVMQLLHEKNRNVYILFTRWGRIGTHGQHQHTPFGTFEEAVKEFQKIFKVLKNYLILIISKSKFDQYFS